jgi:hypothetical protein
MELDSIEDENELVEHLNNLGKRRLIQLDLSRRAQNNKIATSELLNKSCDFGKLFSKSTAIAPYFQKRKYVNRSFDLCSSPIASFLSVSPLFEPRYCYFRFGLPLSSYLTEQALMFEFSFIC